MTDATGAATSKIRIKIGAIEVEYEGSHAYLSEDLPKLLASVVELRQKSKDFDEDRGSDDAVKKGAVKPAASGTVAAMAAKLNVKSGSDLIIAAAAKLTLADGQEKFSRKTLLESMQTASSYYKQSMSSNLTKFLNGLLKDNRLTEPSTDHFALTPSERTKLEGQLAG